MGTEVSAGSGTMYVGVSAGQMRVGGPGDSEGRGREVGSGKSMSRSSRWADGAGSHWGP